MARSGESPPNPGHRPGKRKRDVRTGNGGLEMASSPRNPAGATTPFSRSPSERVQLSLAGLSDTDRDPTRGVRNFPHGALAAEHTQEWRDDDDDDDDDRGQPSNRKNRGPPAVADAERHLDVLLRSLHQMLDRGNIVRAERILGLLLQLRPRSRPIDVRQHNIWALGAEILMRAGEEPSCGGTDDAARDEGQGHARHVSIPNHDFFIPAAWGSSASIDKVKAYFQDLIHEYPYDPRYPNAISAPDFQFAMLGCEIYNVHIEYTSGLARAEKEAGTWHGRHLAEKLDEAASDRGDEWQGEDERQAKFEIRMQALRTMEDITRRMDILIQAPPYRKNNDFLRLRVSASLYAADLLTTASTMTSSSERNATEKRRQLQRQAAVDALEKLVQNGVELDGASQELLGAWTENEDHLPTPPSLHASLPIRRM